MTVLPEDNFARRERREPRRRHVSALVFVLLFLSVALLALSRLGHPYTDVLRQFVVPWTVPTLTVLSDTFAPLRELQDRMSELAVRQDDLAKLRAQNQELRSWRWRARDLKRQRDALARHARLVEPPDVPFLTARVIADSTGPFIRSVLINAGSEHGVKTGQPVINASGLIGRIIAVAPTGARVMLLDDINSRIPVIVGAEHIRAILSGDNSGRPILRHVPKGAELTPSDVVVTSGRGGLFPRALRVGQIGTVGKDIRVKPFAKLGRLTFVRVLLFESPIRQLTETVAGRRR